MSSAVGRVVAGKYRLDSVLGAGGLGVVYRATPVAGGPPVALKLLIRSVDHHHRARLSREAAIVRRLAHPATVRVLDFGEDGAEPFVVFELLEGESLEHRIKTRGRLPESEALSVVRAVLGSLGEAHAAGIVHRDLKPANIFLCASGPVKVLDFGCAKPPPEMRGTPLTREGALIGTPPYMAPEQVDGLTATAATDLYAVGLILAEMLGGQTVYRGVATAVFVRKLKDEIPPFDSALRASRFMPVLERACAGKPERRYASAMDMVSALEQLVPPTSHVVRETRRSWMIVGIVLATLGLAVGLNSVVAQCVRTNPEVRPGPPPTQNPSERPTLAPTEDEDNPLVDEDRYPHCPALEPQPGVPDTDERTMFSDLATSLKTAAKDARRHFRATGQLCRSALPIPATIPDNRGYTPSWMKGHQDFDTGNADEGWNCLQFRMSHVMQYQFGYSAGGGYMGPARGLPDPGPNGFEVWARIDRDGDHKIGVFAITGYPQGEDVVLSDIHCVDALE